MHMRLFYVLVNNFSVMLASGLNQYLAADTVFMFEDHHGFPFYGFLGMPRGCLRFVIVVFPDHTHLLFLKQ